MERYGNSDSGVRAYEAGPDFIKVQFKDNSVYLYTYASAGSHSIERMKSLAAAGHGLSAFISTNVKKAYARKEQ